MTSFDGKMLCSLEENRPTCGPEEEERYEDSRKAIE